MNYPLAYQHFIDSPSLFGDHAPIVLPAAFETLDMKLADPVYQAPERYMRLGTLAEDFLRQAFHQAGYTKVHYGVQIMDEMRTLGELDFIVRDSKDHWLHIELAYKIYVHDPNVGDGRLTSLIGPNRKDSLIEKMMKFREHQFALLHHPLVKNKLEKMDIPHHQIEQRLCLKGQVYLPTNVAAEALSELHPDCIAGHYYSFSDWRSIATDDDQFYVPQKPEWICPPHDQVDWTDRATCEGQLKPFIQERRSLMCWMKRSDAEIERCFVTWW